MHRVKTLQKTLGDLHLEALLVEDPVDLLYLTGIPFSCGTMLITNKETLLFVDGRYTEAASRVCTTHDITKLGTTLNKYSAIGFDGAKTTVLRLKALEELSGKKLTLCKSPLEKLRMIKDPSEIEKIRISCSFASKYMERLHQHLHVGCNEKEVGLMLRKMALEDGIEKLSFDPIIAFGANAAMPHYRTGDKELLPHEVALIDLGTIYQGYCSDMTRTFFAEHTLSKEYELVHEAKALAVKLAHIGTPIGALDEAARVIFEKAGVLPLYLHSLGHGLGLEIHEYPRLRAGNADAELLLEENMVITIEPGLYVEGVGGIRLEDTYLITKHGPEKLT